MMTFEESLDQSQKLSTRFTSGLLAFAAVWLMMTGLAVLYFLSFLTVEALNGWWGILLVMGVFFVGITVRRIWRSRTIHARFRCQHCQQGPSEAQLRAIMTTNCCPHCKQSMFPLNSLGRFVNDIPASEIQQAKSIESFQSTNPYAPPGVQKPQAESTANAQSSVGCFAGLLRAIGGYFQHTFDSVHRLTASHGQLVENANADLEQVGLEPLDDNAANTLVAYYRRVSLIWLIFGFVLPNTLAVFVIADEVFRLYNDVEKFVLPLPLLVILLPASWFWGYLTVAMISWLTPESFLRWLRGGGEPMKSKRSQQTGVYGFFWTTHYENQTRFRQYTLAMRYRCDSTGEACCFIRANGPFRYIAQSAGLGTV